MRTYLLIFLLLPSITFCQADLTIKQLCDSIKNFEEVPSAKMGYSALPSSNYIFYHQLLSISTDSTLLTLIFHDSPIIRATAYQGLIEKYPKQFVKAIPYSEGDTCQILIYQGCIGTRLTVADFVSIIAYQQLKNAQSIYFTKEQAEYIKKWYAIFQEQLKMSYKNSRQVPKQ